MSFPFQSSFVGKARLNAQACLPHSSLRSGLALLLRQTRWRAQAIGTVPMFGTFSICSFILEERCLWYAIY